jgi:hypothetical protein
LCIVPQTQKYIPTFTHSFTTATTIMPRKKPTAEELEQKALFDSLIKNIKGNDKPTVDIPRAINLFEKAQKNITQALAVLRGEEVEEEVDPNRKKAGRPKKATTTDGDLFPGASEAAGDMEGTPVAPTTKAKKGTSVGA